MTTHIAHFTARHRIIQVVQNSIFIWQQESGEVDPELLSDKIRRESARHFFQLVAGSGYPVSEADISITVHKAEPFNG